MGFDQKKSRRLFREDDIVDCFKIGGGVPYSRYPRFYAVMAEDSG